MIEKKLICLIFTLLAIVLIFSGCTANASGAQSVQSTTSDSPKMSPVNFSVSSTETLVGPTKGVRLTLIKFRGNTQCVSCINLGKFANSTLQKNFQKELSDGTVKYLDINAESDFSNSYVQKYRPTYASLFLLTESAAGEKYEELVDAWYYTGNEAQYTQYLTSLLRARLGE